MRVTQTRRERDIENFLHWLDRKGLYIGRYTDGTTFNLSRINTHSFDKERLLVSEYVDRFEAPR